MSTTGAELLRRVRDANDAEAWQEFHAIYAPMLLRYASGRGLSHEDAQEVRDRCLEIVVRRLPGFHYDPTRGRFRSWLRRIAHDVVADLGRRRRPGRLDTADAGRLQAPEPPADEVWARAWLHENLLQCLAEVRDDVPRTSYQAFSMLLHGASVPEVEAALGLNANQVYKARSRVLKRVRARAQRRGLDEADRAGD